MGNGVGVAVGGNQTIVGVGVGDGVAVGVGVSSGSGAGVIPGRQALNSHTLESKPRKTFPFQFLQDSALVTLDNVRDQIFVKRALNVVVWAPIPIAPGVIVVEVSWPAVYDSLALDVWIERDLGDRECL